MITECSHLTKAATNIFQDSTLGPAERDWAKVLNELAEYINSVETILHDDWLITLASDEDNVEGHKLFMKDRMALIRLPRWNY